MEFWQNSNLENQSESSNNFLSGDFQKVYYTGGYKNCFQGGFFHFRHQKRHLVVIKDELVVLVLYYAAFLVNFGVAACLLKRLSIYYCLGLKTRAGDSI